MAETFFVSNCLDHFHPYMDGGCKALKRKKGKVSHRAM